MSSNGSGTSNGNTRGYRNNNPLNIRFSSSNNWRGQTGSDIGGFAIFNTMENGLRAGFINLRTYHNRKIRNIRQIVYTWAPVSDGNPNNENYVNHVSNISGIAPVVELQFNYATYSGIVKGMSEFESRYTPTETELKNAWNSM